MANKILIFPKHADDLSSNDFFALKLIDNGDNTYTAYIVDQDNPGAPALASLITATGATLMGGGAGAPFPDTTAIVEGSAAATKLLRFEIDGFTTGTERVLTPPDASGVIVLVDLAQTLTNKTLTAPVINNPVLSSPQINDLSSDHQYVFVASELAADRNITLPLLTADDTFVFANFIQTLANKTLASPRITTAILDANGNEILIISPTASAVNELSAANAATGNNPALSASGDDANVGINLTPKGTGNVVVTANQLIVPLGSTTVPSLRIGSAVQTGLSASGSGLTLQFVISGATQAVMTGSLLGITSAMQFTFSSGSNPATQDTGLKRAAAKITCFTDGSTGAGSFTGMSTSPAQITADQNNYNPAGSSYFQRWNSDASRNITGLTFTAAPVDGQTHVIVNVGAQPIVLVNQSASSTAANRFLCSTGADITLSADQAADVIYDGTSQRWRVFKRN